MRCTMRPKRIRRRPMVRQQVRRIDRDTGTSLVAPNYTIPLSNPGFQRSAGHPAAPCYRGRP